MVAFLSRVGALVDLHGDDHLRVDVTAHRRDLVFVALATPERNRHAHDLNDDRPVVGTVDATFLHNRKLRIVLGVVVDHTFVDQVRDIYVDVVYLVLELQHVAHDSCLGLADGYRTLSQLVGDDIFDPLFRRELSVPKVLRLVVKELNDLMEPLVDVLWDLVDLDLPVVVDQEVVGLPDLSCGASE